MSQLPTSQLSVVQALEFLRAEDERVAADAEAALNSLTWDAGLETVTQYGLQHFLWYELPVKWIVDLEHKRHLATALGRLLGLVGLPRYAALCHAEETREILAVYERGDGEGLAAFHKAQERSGVQPPDLPELTWGPVMGHEETTRDGPPPGVGVAAALEAAEAVAAGWALADAHKSIDRCRAGDRPGGAACPRDRPASRPARRVVVLAPRGDHTTRSAGVLVVDGVAVLS